MSWWERIERESYQVPMLLLVLALGGTLGIGIALCLRWIELSDAMANFVGGVAGAALGAAGGALTAIVVLRRQRVEALQLPLNQIRYRVAAGRPNLARVREVIRQTLDGSGAPHFTAHYPDLVDMVR